MVDEQPGRTEDSVDLDSMLDLATPWCLRVAATLRLTEHIAAGRTAIAELAAAAGCPRRPARDAAVTQGQTDSAPGGIRAGKYPSQPVVTV